jgi:hypothetical protein
MTCDCATQARPSWPGRAVGVAGVKAGTGLQPVPRCRESPLALAVRSRQFNARPVPL